MTYLLTREEKHEVVRILKTQRGFLRKVHNFRKLGESTQIHVFCTPKSKDSYFFKISSENSKKLKNIYWYRILCKIGPKNEKSVAKPKKSCVASKKMYNVEKVEEKPQQCKIITLPQVELQNSSTFEIIPEAKIVKSFAKFILLQQSEKLEQQVELQAEVVCNEASDTESQEQIEEESEQEEIIDLDSEQQEEIVERVASETDEEKVQNILTNCLPKMQIKDILFFINQSELKNLLLEKILKEFPLTECNESIERKNEYSIVNYFKSKKYLHFISSSRDSKEVFYVDQEGIKYFSDFQSDYISECGNKGHDLTLLFVEEVRDFIVNYEIFRDADFHLEILKKFVARVHKDYPVIKEELIPSFIEKVKPCTENEKNIISECEVVEEFVMNEPKEKIKLDRKFISTNYTKCVSGKPSDFGNCFVVESENEARAVIKKDCKIADILKLTKEDIIHEYNQTDCRFFCDLDDKYSIMDKVNFEKFVKFVGENFKKFFVAYFFLEAKEIHISYVYTKQDCEYNSSHMIFHIYADGKQVCTKSAKDQYTFWKKFSKFHSEKYKYIEQILDLAVYKQCTQLRIIHSKNKYGYVQEPVHKKIYKKEVLKFIYIKSNSPNAKQAKSDGIHCFEEVSDSYDTPVNKDSDVDQLKSTVSNGKKKLVLIPKGEIFNCEGFENTYGITGIILEKDCAEDFFITCKAEDKLVLEDIFDCSAIAEKRDYFEYERQLFATIIKNCKVNIDKRKDWTAACLRIWSFYHFLTREQRCQKVVKFCKSKGFDTKEYIEENERLCNYFERKCIAYPYCMINLKKFFEFDMKAETFCASEIDYNSFVKKDDRLVVLKSGTNTKKTCNFLKTYLPTGRVLVITYRRSLAKEIMTTADWLKSNADNPEDYNITYYQDVKDYTVFTGNLVCQLESLHKFFATIKNFDFIFLDEIENLVGQFSHCVEIDLRDKKIILEKLNCIFRYFMMKKKVFAVSGNVSDATLNFFKSFKQPFSLYHNTYADKADWTLYPMHSDAWQNYLLISAMEGKNIIIPCSSKKHSRSLSLMLSKIGKTLVITGGSVMSKNPEEDAKSNEMLTIVAIPPEYWHHFRFVIYSPTIESGVNCVTKNHFDFIFGKFFTGTNCYKSCYQMLFRLRNPKEKKIFLSIEDKGCKLRSGEKNIWSEKEINASKDKVARGEKLSEDDAPIEECKLSFIAGDNKQWFNKTFQLNFIDNFSMKTKTNFTDAQLTLKYADTVSKFARYHYFYKFYSNANLEKLLINELEESGMKVDNKYKEEYIHTKKNENSIHVDYYIQKIDIFAELGNKHILCKLNGFEKEMQLDKEMKALCRTGHFFEGHTLGIKPRKDGVEFVYKITPGKDFICKVNKYFKVNAMNSKEWEIQNKYALIPGTKKTADEVVGKINFKNYHLEKKSEEKYGFSKIIDCLPITDKDGFLETIRLSDNVDSKLTRITNCYYITKFLEGDITNLKYGQLVVAKIIKMYDEFKDDYQKFLNSVIEQHFDNLQIYFGKRNKFFKEQVLKAPYQTKSKMLNTFFKKCGFQVSKKGFENTMGSGDLERLMKHLDFTMTANSHVRDEEKMIKDLVSCCDMLERDKKKILVK